MYFDLHTVHALANGWAGYRDSLASFSALFPNVNAQTLATWHAQLVAEPPVFCAAYAPGTSENYPIVSVEFMGESVVGDYFGQSGGVSNGVRTLAMHTQQSIEIAILSKSDEVTHALARVVQATMLRARVSFLNANYFDLRYEGSAQLSPEQLLVAEEHGMFIQRLMYSAGVEITVPEQLDGITLDNVSWFVQLEDVEEDPTRDPAIGAGTPGAVAPIREDDF